MDIPGRLTEYDHDEIRAAYRAGIGIKHLAREYQRRPATIRTIIRATSEVKEDTMAIEAIDGGGGIVITGEDDIDLYRLMTLRSALGLEIKGIKVKRWSIYAAVKKEFGFHGTRSRVWIQLNNLIERRVALRQAKLEMEAMNAPPE